jgi:hypothetical protein
MTSKHRHEQGRSNCKMTILISTETKIKLMEQTSETGIIGIERYGLRMTLQMKHIPHHNDPQYTY